MKGIIIQRSLPAIFVSATLLISGSPMVVATPDTTPPAVSDVVAPAGETGSQVSVSAVIIDASGVNKAYFYLDRPDGRNALGVRMWDDGSNGDVTPGDNRHSADADLSLPDGSFHASLLTYDSKYNETRVSLGSVDVASGRYRWQSPTDQPAPTPPPTPTPTLTPEPTPTPSGPPTDDTRPPVVSNVVVPVGETGPKVPVRATVIDDGAGVNKVYLYFDQPDGRNVQGVRLHDDGQGVDAAAGDHTYSAQPTLELPDGQFVVSVLTYDGKYNETKPVAASLTVVGGRYHWSAANQSPEPSPAPTPTPTPTSSPTPAPTPTPTSTPVPSTSPTYPNPGTNLLVNGSFEPDLSYWTAAGAVSVTAEADEGAAAAEFAATPVADARLAQVVRGLRPMTQYTLAVRVRTSGSEPGDVWASYGVDGDVQLSKTNSVQAADYRESRFSFFTNRQPEAVEVWLMAGRNDPGGVARFDNVRLVEGTLPLPSPSPGEPPLSAIPAAPTLPAPGANIVRNGDFASGADHWVLDGAHPVSDSQGNTFMAVTPSELTARAVQDVPVLLAPNATYTLTARARTTRDFATVGLVASDGSASAHINVEPGDWRTYTATFTTGPDYVGGKVTAEFYKGNVGTLEVDDIALLALGGEWLDTPDPTPQPPTPLYDDFDGPGLDSDKWLIADKGWGGDNGGVVPENVSIADGKVRLAANGDRYSGPVIGHGGRKTRVGAAIVTRDYYASGRFKVRAKVPRQEGACTAFWIFHYLEYQPGDSEYYEEPNRIRNTEIDWEFPTARDDGSADDSVTFDRARANAWGGKLGGEGGNVSLRPDIGRLVADGQFHDYAFDWHAGGGDITPYITWSIDGVEVARYEGSDYGQDNVPSRAARFWVGIWFPASGYRDLVGWAGNPDFDTTTLEIDSIRITPFHEPNDRYEAETWPNGFYANPGQYP